MDLEALRALVAVVETGSVNQAAARLGLPRSTVTRRLASLEAHFGCPLLTTSRDGSVPTTAGARLAKSASDLLRHASEVDAQVRLGLDEPGRPLRVWMQASMHPEMLAMAMVHVSSLAPGLRFDVRITDDPFAPIDHQPPDVSVAFGRPRAGPYLIFRAARLSLAFRASPTYLDTHGRPTTIEELTERPLWAWQGALVETGDGPAVELKGGGLHRIDPVIVTNDFHVLHVALQSGCCIGLVPSGPFDVFQPDEEEILPDQLGGDIGMWLAVAEAHANLPWIRLVMDEARTLFSRYQGMDEGSEELPDWLRAEPA